MMPEHDDPPRRALYVPVAVVDDGVDRAGFSVLAPDEPGYEDAYARCVHAYHTYSIPMPYVAEEQAP